MKEHLKEQLFTHLVTSWMEHLAPEHKKFEELVTLSKVNGRVRNVFVFYTLSNHQYFNRFEELSRSDQTLQNMRYELAKALKRLEQEKEKDISSLAKFFRHKYFRHMQLVVDEGVYDVSAEMAKLFKTMFNSYRLTQEDSEYKRLQRKKKYKKFNLAILK